jgi:hypothetical protein
MSVLCTEESGARLYFGWGPPHECAGEGNFGLLGSDSTVSDRALHSELANDWLNSHTVNTTTLVLRISQHIRKYNPFYPSSSSRPFSCPTFLYLRPVAPWFSCSCCFRQSWPWLLPVKILLHINATVPSRMRLISSCICTNLLLYQTTQPLTK